MKDVPKSSTRSVLNKSWKPVLGGREIVKVALVQNPRSISTAKVAYGDHAVPAGKTFRI